MTRTRNTLHGDVCIIIIRMRNVTDVEKIKTYSVFFPPKIVPFMR